MMTLKVAYTPAPWPDPPGGTDDTVTVALDSRVGFPQAATIDASALDVIRPTPDDIETWIGGVAQVTKLGVVWQDDNGHVEWPPELANAEQWYQTVIARCACGRTATMGAHVEVGGVRHGKDECFPCDPRGERAGDDIATRLCSSATPITVIMVRLGDGDTRILAVERAWLLNDSGRTIERVAP